MAHLRLQIKDENEGHAIHATKANPFLSARKHSVKKQAFGELRNVLHSRQGTAATPFQTAPQKSFGFGNVTAPKSKQQNDFLFKWQDAAKQTITPFKSTKIRSTGFSATPVGATPFRANNIFGKPKPIATEVPRSKIAAPYESELAKLNLIKPQKMEKGQKMTNATDGNVATFTDDFDPNMFDDFDFPSACCTKNCGKNLHEIWSEMYPIEGTLFDKVMEDELPLPVDDNDEKPEENANLEKHKLILEPQVELPPIKNVNLNDDDFHLVALRLGNFALPDLDLPEFDFEGI